jgi:hypothetical protein
MILGWPNLRRSRMRRTRTARVLAAQGTAKLWGYRYPQRLGSRNRRAKGLADPRGRVQGSFGSVEPRGSDSSMECVSSTVDRFERNTPPLAFCRTVPLSERAHEKRQTRHIERGAEPLLDYHLQRQVGSTPFVPVLSSLLSGETVQCAAYRSVLGWRRLQPRCIILLAFLNGILEIANSRDREAPARKKYSRRRI